MKKILDFIIYSNVFIALCCVAVTLQTAIIFNQSNSIYEYAIINFIATFILYNLQRLYYSAKYDTNPKYVWYTKNRRILLTIIVLLLLLSFNFLWAFFITNIKHLLIYSSLSIISILYFLPPIQLKKYGVLKPFLISFVFVTIAILIPLNFKVTQPILIYTLAQFFFISTLCVLFDIRDIETDKLNTIKTIPLILGIKKTKIIAIVLVSSYLILIFFLQINYLNFSVVLVFSLALIITALSSVKRNNYFYLLMVDGLIIAQYLLIYFKNS